MSVCAGKYLRLDLSAGTWHDEPIAAGEVQRWLLGSGMAAKLYHQEMDPELDPLDPSSPLLVFNGAPTGCRSSWCGRSPLTGIWNEANVGAYWGAELRFCGYRGVDPPQ
jgi:aldehyde:ferredoxin oxidoreductase